MKTVVSVVFVEQFGKSTLDVVRSWKLELECGHEEVRHIPHRLGLGRKEYQAPSRVKCGTCANLGDLGLPR